LSTTQEIAIPSSGVARRADFTSQSTQVEQSRAVAEVQAMVLVAQQCPRNIPGSIASMRESCAQMGLAERAFFRFPRGGQTVAGPSVHLARELARCWGNIDYGIKELRRDDVGHYSEMQAWAWDMQTNARSTTTFVVPHMRDKRGGPEVLTDLRDVYENNANQGARRLRETIFSIMPTWFTEEAKALCTKTLTDGGGKPIATRIADALRAFEGLGVRVDRLERRFGPSTGWTVHDVAQLLVVYASIQQGTVNADDEFPQERVTTSDVLAPAPAPASPPADAAPPVATPPAQPAPADEAPEARGQEQRPPTARQMGEQVAAQQRSKRQPRPNTPPDAGSEYGDVVGAPVNGTPLQQADTLTGPEMIVHVAATHGVDTGDAVARMCSEIVGREVVTPKDLKTAEIAQVLTALNGLGEDVDYPFADPAGATVPAPVPIPDAKAAAPVPAAPPSPQQTTEADSWSGDEWRAYLTERKVKVTVFWAYARTVVKDRTGTSIGSIDELTGIGVGDELRAWIDSEAGS
jgi:hypothetical protein